MSEKENLGSGIPRVDTVANIGNAIKNTTDVSIFKSVPARVRQRMRELKQLSSAKIEKIQTGHHKRFITTPPTIFMGGLDASIQGGIGVITYSVFEKDKDGNKKLHENIVERITEDGRKVRVNASSNYIVKEEVVETIEYRKPIKVEKFEPVE